MKNKIVKRILIGTGAALALVIILLLITFLRLNSERKYMASIPTGKIMEGVYALKDGNVNLYVLQSQEGLALIDAGNDADNVLQEFRKAGLNPDDVKLVFLTHTDRDHIAGLKLFKNAKIYISEAEVQMVNGTKSRLLFFKSKLDYKYDTLKDLQTITFGGFKIQGLSLPGHTLGSMGYLVNETVLFSGDIMSLKNGSAELFIRLFSMEEALEVASINRIKALPGIKAIYTAHHGMTADVTGAFANWKKQ